MIILVVLMLGVGLTLLCCVAGHLTQSGNRTVSLWWIRRKHE